MIIGFDFDKIFINTPPFLPDSIVDLLYKGGSHFKKGKKAEELHYRIPNTIEQKIRIISHYPPFRQPLKENIAALNTLCKNKNLRLFLISSRFSFLNKRTDTLLKKYQLNNCFEKIYFNYKNEQPHLFKLKMIKDLNINVYVEDDIDLVLFLADKMHDLKIFWLSKRKETISLPENVIAVKDLRELKKYF